MGGAGKEHGFEFGGPGAFWLGRFERLTSKNPPYFRKICQSVHETQDKHFVMRLCLRRDMYQESGVVTLRR